MPSAASARRTSTKIAEWSATSAQDALAGRRQLLPGRPPVGRAGDGAGLDLLAQAGDADLEELVEVAGEDRQELDPLEEGVSGVARLVEHARVELEPGELAVEVRELGLFRARLAGRVPVPTDGGAGSGLDGGHLEGGAPGGSVRAHASGGRVGMRLGLAGEDSTAAMNVPDARWARTLPRIAPRRLVFGDVAPFAGGRIDPDPHRLAGRRVLEALVGRAEARVERLADRFAAPGPCGAALRSASADR